VAQPLIQFRCCALLTSDSESIAATLTIGYSSRPHLFSGVYLGRVPATK
jgi:hypothetical protein